MRGFIPSIISMSIAVNGLMMSNNPRHKRTKQTAEIPSWIGVDGCQRMLGRAASTGAAKKRWVKRRSARGYCCGNSFKTPMSNSNPVASLANPSVMSAPAGPSRGIVMHPTPMASSKPIQWLNATSFGFPITYRQDGWIVAPMTRVRILNKIKIANSGPTGSYWLP